MREASCKTNARLLLRGQERARLDRMKHGAGLRLFSGGGLQTLSPKGSIEQGQDLNLRPPGYETGVKGSNLPKTSLPTIRTSESVFSAA
jgi:hypothetical protein